MKTNLPTSINTVEEATAYLTELYNNDESYHPESDAHDVIWGTCEKPTPAECDQLNKLSDDMYNLKEFGGEEGQFDPCRILMDLMGQIFED